MEKVTSQDGTSIAFHHSGAGSPLILVHGTGSASTRWAHIFPPLEEHFNVYAVDRRGRGGSGDSHTYAIEREFEDIAAVINALGEPADLLGHSFGGFCALEAALLTPNLRKLILYETPLHLPGAALDPEGLIDSLQALLQAGDRDGALIMFYREVANMPPHEIEQLRSTPVWPVRMAAAHTLLREMRAFDRYTFDASRFKNLHIPTLLLLGGESPQFFQDTTEALDKALPNSEIVVLPGQKHIAMDTAPDLFVYEVLTFLLAPA